MKTKPFTSNLLLLLAAAIWGFAFVAMRLGIEHIGPFTFSGIRFALGSLSLVPLILYSKASDKKDISDVNKMKVTKAGFYAGSVLFLATSFQQIGLIYTTAGKSAFITGLYIVLVPIIGILILKHKINKYAWVGALIALVGLYFLCVEDQLSISFGDLLELIGAFFWAIHILLIDHFAKKVNSYKLASFQFAVCSLLSLITAFFIESVTIAGIIDTTLPILYGGLCSVGIAFTLQIIGQKNAPPAHAAIILSLEAVFGVIGGILLLNEHLSLKGLMGCVLMLTGMLLSQKKDLSKELQGN